MGSLGVEGRGVRGAPGLQSASVVIVVADSVWGLKDNYMAGAAIFAVIQVLKMFSEIIMYLCCVNVLQSPDSATNPHYFSFLHPPSPTPTAAFLSLFSICVVQD